MLFFCLKKWLGSWQSSELQKGNQRNTVYMFASQIVTTRTKSRLMVDVENGVNVRIYKFLKLKSW